MDAFNASDAKVIFENLINTIHKNSAFLSAVDGAIGDGDHGINMDKGFQKTKEHLSTDEFDFYAGLDNLGNTLLEIGGAMGPLYGTFFMQMADVSIRKTCIDKELFVQMLSNATRAVQNLGGAQLGDKTLLDTLIPAKF